MADADGGNLAPSTVAKAVQVFNKAMRSALEDRLISVNPVERLPLPRIQTEEMRFLTPDELWRLADAIDQRYRAFVLLAGYSGLRVGELFALRWDNVDMLRRQVTVSETHTDLAGHISFGPPKTRAALRTVSVPGFVTDELAKVPLRPPAPRDLVFTSPDGHPCRPTLFRRRFWTPAVEAAELTPLRIHDLRHTAISLGSRPAPIRSRSPSAPVTPACRSSSTAMATCSPSTTIS